MADGPRDGHAISPQYEDTSPWILPATTAYSPPMYSDPTKPAQEKPTPQMYSGPAGSAQEEPTYGDSSGPLFKIYSKSAEEKDTMAFEGLQKEADGIIFFVRPRSPSTLSILIRGLNRMVYFPP